MLDFLTKENITFVLALIGSLGTIATLISKFIHNRVKLSVNLYGWLNTGKGLLLYVGIINSSHIPISVTSISMRNEEAAYYCVEVPKIVYEETTKVNNVEVNRDTKYSMNIPISLSAMFSSHGYVYFELPQDVLKNLSTDVIFLIHTNRNKVVQMTLHLNKELLLH